MSGRGEYQKRLAALVSAAAADNLTFEDILPAEIEERFKELAELKQARVFIAELELRETELQTVNETLQNEVEKKQKAIDNLPDDHVARLTELHQAYRQIELHKQTEVHLNERAERYRQQLDDNVGKQHANTSAAAKIEALQAQVEHQQGTIAKLMDDNRKSEAIYKQLRESDKHTLESKTEQLAKKEALIAQLHQQIDDATDTLLTLKECDPLAVQEENVGLLSRNLSLSEENKALQDQYTMVKEQLGEILATGQDGRKAQLFAAAISETKTLNRFFLNAFEVLKAFSHSFQTTPVRSNIEFHLDAAQEALAGCRAVKEAVRPDTDGAGDHDLEEFTLCKELDSMAVSAGVAMDSLEAVHGGFWKFINRLSEDPKVLSEVNAELVEQGRPRTIPVHGY
jgi:myosin heavy subunit